MLRGLSALDYVCRDKIEMEDVCRRRPQQCSRDGQKPEVKEAMTCSQASFDNPILGSQHDFW